jgi:beta-fructofuranosidase/levanase/fructan beta-fructosidase
VDGFIGSGLVNTFRDGDRSQGTLTSPEFEIDRKHINFLIGGGNHAGATCMNLLLDGKVARTATGSAAERLAWKSWNVAELRGRKARLEIVDRHSGGWGHVNVDQIALADEPARPATTPALWADFAPDYYAAVSWSDVPKRDGRRLWLGWMSDWRYAGDAPTSPWRSAMSIPRELVLRRTSEGLRLVQKPVRELQALRGEKHSLRNAGLPEANEWLKSRNIAGPLWEIEAEIGAGKAGADWALNVLRGRDEWTAIRCDAERNAISLDRTRSGRVDFHGAFPGKYEAPLLRDNSTVKIRVFVDTSSVEVFAKGGESVLTALVFPEQGDLPFEFAGGPGIKIRKLDVWKLRPAAPIREAQVK